MFRKFFVALVLSIITMIFSIAEAADTWACSYQDNGTRFDYYVRDVPSTMHFLNSPPTFITIGIYIPMCVDVVRVDTDLRTGKVKNTSTMEYSFYESRGNEVYSINRGSASTVYGDSISAKIARGIHEMAIKFVKDTSELAYEKKVVDLRDDCYVKSVSRGSKGHVYAEVLHAQYDDAKDFWLAGGIKIYEFWSDENNGLHYRTYYDYDTYKKKWKFSSEPDNDQLIAIFKTTIKMLKNQTS